MKFCTECGKELEQDAKVCGNCGKRIVADINASNEMTQNTAINNNQQYNNVQTKQSNGLAIAGFVISLVSFCCCGSFSGLGLIFSIIGLVDSKKKNGAGKGLAIAGIIISSILLFMFIVFTITGAIGSFMEGFSEGLSEGIGTSL